MTEVRPDVDLGSLTRARVGAEVKPPRRMLKFVIPIAILAVFGAILATSIRDAFEKTVDVTVVRPKPMTDDDGGGRGPASIALQAAGWVEPEPFAVRVSALASGVVRDMLVRESDLVKKGDPIARLIDDDARLALEKAEAALLEAHAEHARAQVELDFAQKNFDTALAVTESAGAAKAQADGKAAESRSRAAAVAGAESDMTIAREELSIQKRLAEQGAGGYRAVEIAEAKVRAAAAALEIRKADAAAAASEAEQARIRAERARRDLELRYDDRQRVEAARRSVEVAAAKARSMTASRDEAALRLDRMTIRAPTSGVVLERLALAGTLLHAEDPDHAGVCVLFDPRQIRIRVDVAQSDVAKVTIGQKAEIQSQARQKPYQGDVIRIVERADIQKVTLQVHVRVSDADTLLRPEMLCQVRFLGGGPESGPSGRAASAGLLVPGRVIVDDRFVWTLDPESPRARRRPIEVAGRSGDWAVVRQGLNVTDKIIDLGRDQIEEGTKVRAREGE